MTAPYPSIMDVVTLANRLRQKLYKQEGLSESTPVLNGLASGFDTGLTLLEASTGAFQGLTRDTAREIVEHFMREGDRYTKSHPEIAIWYVAYAEAVGQLYLRNRESA